MEVIVRIIKTNPWTGITKWPTCFDYVSSYWTRSGNLYTGLSAEDATRLEKKKLVILRDSYLPIVRSGILLLLRQEEKMQYLILIDLRMN